MGRFRHYGVSEQAKAGKHRLEDAKALLKAVRCRGAMYMAGYAVECQLKAKLMRMFKCRHLQELEESLIERSLLPAQYTVFTHELEVLLRLTKAIDRLRQDAAMWQNFNLVNRWVPAWRYNPIPATSEDAEDFLDGVSRLVHWIEVNV